MFLEGNTSFRSGYPFVYKHIAFDVELIDVRVASPQTFFWKVYYYKHRKEEPEKRETAEMLMRLQMYLKIIKFFFSGHVFHKR